MTGSRDRGYVSGAEPNDGPQLTSLEADQERRAADERLGFEPKERR